MLRIAVVGSGIAGLIAGLALAGRAETTVFCKAGLGESNSRYAQGGIAAVLDPELRTPGDTVAWHVADTLAAGAGLNDPAAVELLCREAASVIRVLAGHGVDFDADEAWPPGSGHWALGLEAAHSFARILHVGGDASGAGIVAALAAAVHRCVEASTLQLREHTELLELLVRDGAVRGVRTWTGSGAEIEQEFDAVLLASGGGGQLFEHTTNPAGATADGLAAAWRAGAVVQDLEFFQFHPTLVDHERPFMVSEAVRGEGAVLLDEHGERFMLDVDPAAELAPRDVVARGIAAKIASGGKVFLDARGIAAERGAGFLARRFPGISAQLADRGFDWARQSVPVIPGAHYWMGGIATDLAGRSSLRGLFAIGEAACTGAHGANRLASNSLLEAAVFAARAARAALGAEQHGPWPVFEATPLGLENGLLDPEPGEIPRLMMSRAGLIRDAGSLAVAAKQLALFRPDAPLVTAAQLLVAAAQAREGSIGAHWRSDFPHRDLPQPSATPRRSWINSERLAS